MLENNTDYLNFFLYRFIIQGNIHRYIYIDLLFIQVIIYYSRHSIYYLLSNYSFINLSQI